MTDLRIPAATYRLQLNSQFRFKDAGALVPYLQSLGITDVYASPILQARRGSEHGYDVTDPTRLNSDLGSEDDFKTWIRDLQKRGMAVLLDIVPNHMAASIENPWWADVLENGPGSAYATYFDIDWHPPNKALENKVLLPVLAGRYADVLESCELTLTFEQKGFFVRYADLLFPVAPKSYPRVIGYRLGNLREAVGSQSAPLRELRGILAALSELPERVGLSSEISGERRRGLEAIKERLWELYSSSAEIRGFLEENLRIFNGRKGKPGSFVLLDGLLSEQAYVLSFWRAANEEINYRRFFAVVELVGVRVDDPLVFDATHAAILKMIETGDVRGLRVDHIDGLRDPLGYLRRLQERICGGENATDQFYLIVEKILAHGEQLPQDWPVSGTTGYDFLNVVNALFVDAAGYESLLETYARFAGAGPGYEELLYEKKQQIMDSLLAVEIRSLGHHLSLLAEGDRYARDIPQADLSQSLIEVTAALGVYRTYARSSEMAPSERRSIAAAVAAAHARNPRLNQAALEFVSDVLTLRERNYVSPAQREARLNFVMRWQQLSGPIMAKGFEDTVLYVFNPLVSLNEVGSAHISSVSLAEFHDFLRARAKARPHDLNATTTHDTKRSEDVRARLNVLSEMPAEWKRHLEHWANWNLSLKTKVEGRAAPDPNEEILLYQTMLGAWPLDEAEVAGFGSRIKDYMIKATREAKVHTKWTRPNLKHERALSRFIDALLAKHSRGQFWQEFVRFARRISVCGAVNALALATLKMTAPGVPDFFQGSELWDLRLVDPDNRRPVDFEKRQGLLEEIKAREHAGDASLIEELVEHWQDGRIKLFLISKILEFRRNHRPLFEAGEYAPIRTSGTMRQHVCCFMRHYKNERALIAVPLLASRMVEEGKPAFADAAWAGTRLDLGSKAPRHWSNVLTGDRIEASKLNGRLVLPLNAVLRRFPVALLHAV